MNHDFNNRFSMIKLVFDSRVIGLNFLTKFQLYLLFNGTVELLVYSVLIFVNEVDYFDIRE